MVMMIATLEQWRTPNPTTDSKITSFVDPLAGLFAHSLRSPVLRRPDEEGLENEEIFFPSLDGVNLEGWFIPAKGSNKLNIANHPLPRNRSGFPGHLPDFGLFGGFEVSFIKDYKALHNAGYNVLAYDLRNPGRSGAGSSGICGIGLLESRDVVDSIKYARSQGDWPVEPLSRDAKALIALQPVSSRIFVETGAKNAGLEPAEAAKAFVTKIYHLTGFRLDELTPIPYTKYVNIPTLVAQIRKDESVKPSDAQNIYDGIGAQEKELFWIEGTTRRFDGYNYFGEHPERMLGWFKKFLR
ncbi:hypothetical protein BDV12DRAFT_193628 [Aspergillus spectabilis]